MKKIIAVVIAVIVIIWALLYWKPSSPVNPAPEALVNQQAAVADDTFSIEQDLQGIGVDDTSADFTDLNNDIDSL